MMMMIRGLRVDDDDDDDGAWVQARCLPASWEE